MQRGPPRPASPAVGRAAPRTRAATRRRARSGPRRRCSVELIDVLMAAQPAARARADLHGAAAEPARLRGTTWEVEDLRDRLRVRPAGEGETAAPHRRRRLGLAAAARHRELALHRCAGQHHLVDIAAAGRAPVGRRAGAELLTAAGAAEVDGVVHAARVHDDRVAGGVRARVGIAGHAALRDGSTSTTPACQRTSAHLFVAGSRRLRTTLPA